MLCGKGITSFFGSTRFRTDITPLHRAAGQGRLDVVQLLLAARADVHKKDM